MDQFFVGPGQSVLSRGEILTEIEIPKPPPNTGSAYCKHQRRQALDLPILGVAVFLSLDKATVTCSDLLCTASPISALLHRLEDDRIQCNEIRIAMGVVAPTPMRAKHAESLLRGKMLSDEGINEVSEAASREAQPRDSIRGEAWYRKDMIRVLVRRMIMKAIERVIQPDETVFPERLW
jgi:carbon-monoxide dehydrogenase medium subunit